MFTNKTLQAFCIISLFLPFICCQTIENQTPSDKIINEFLSKETQGEFLKSSSWITENVINHEIIPGFDAAIIVTKYEYRIITENENEVTYLVDYYVIGELLQNAEGFYIKKNSRKESVTIQTQKVGSNWKIVHPLTNPHVYPKFIKKYLSEQEYESLIN